MRKMFLTLLVTISVFVVFVSCGPTSEEQKPVEIDLAVEEQRRKAKEDYERARAADAAESFRSFMAVWADETKPRAYEKAIEDVTVENKTLVISLSIADEFEARSLCNFTLTGWSDRRGFGVAEVKVVHTDGTVLAESQRLSTGAHICN
jgi:hypothetical protein